MRRLTYFLLAAIVLFGILVLARAARAGLFENDLWISDVRFAGGYLHVRAEATGDPIVYHHVYRREADDPLGLASPIEGEEDYAQAGEGRLPREVTQRVKSGDLFWVVFKAKGYPSAPTHWLTTP